MRVCGNRPCKLPDAILGSACSGFAALLCRQYAMQRGCNIPWFVPLRDSDVNGDAVGGQSKSKWGPYAVRALLSVLYMPPDAMRSLFGDLLGRAGLCIMLALLLSADKGLQASRRGASWEPSYHGGGPRCMHAKDLHEDRRKGRFSHLTHPPHPPPVFEPGHTWPTKLTIKGLGRGNRTVNRNAESLALILY